MNNQLTQGGNSLWQKENLRLLHFLPLWMLLALVALLCYTPFSHIGFTCGDDLENYLITRQGWDACWEHAKWLAGQQGRFYFLIAQPCYDLAWAIDDWGYTHALQYGMLLISYLLFARLLQMIFHSRPLTYLTLLLLIVQTPITENNHMPFMAYPFVFAFSCSLMWLALLQYVRYCGNAKYKHLIFCALLFFAASLFYENYILFLAFLMLFNLLRWWRGKGFFAMWSSRKFYTEQIPFVSVIVIYAALYLSYRSYQMHINPDVAFYSGASLSDQFSLPNFFRVLGRCTRTVLPMQNFERYHEVCTTNYLGYGAIDSKRFALTNASTRVYVVALAVGLLIYLLLGRIRTERWSLRSILCVMGIAIVWAFFSHTLIGITPKYNNDWYCWMNGYVTTYYSFFGIILSMIMIGLLLVKLFSQRRLLAMGVRLGLALLMMVFVIIGGYANENLSHEWQRSQSRFFEIDRLHSEGVFQSLPRNAILYTEEFYSSSAWGSSLTKEYDFIDRYIRMRTGLYFDCAHDEQHLNELLSHYPPAPLYQLKQEELPHTARVVVSIYHVSGNIFDNKDQSTEL